MKRLTKPMKSKVALKRPAYGSEPWDPVRTDARLLLEAVKMEYPDVDFFTREDCLFLHPFMHVATITRYNTVRLAVRYLIETGELREVSRTQLALPGKAKYVLPPNDLQDQFVNTVCKLLTRLDAIDPGHEFAVMDLVDIWTTDKHLTENTKRTIARNIMRAVARDGFLEMVGPHTYRMARK